MPKISIITAIHNGLAINKIYLESIEKYTHYPYELIIVDNLSTDGSREYFTNKGANVIVNPVNYSYPVSQNQGIAAATGDYLFFLNNDLFLSPQWDKHLIDAATKHSLDILSASGIENMGNFKDTQTMQRKWKRTKNPFSVIGFNYTTLKWMLKLMYGNWESFCNKLVNTNKDRVVEGIVGDNVMMTRKAINSIGLWDERLQDADFDLFMRAKQRSVQVGDIKPCHIALGAYIHHFGRMTVKYGKKKAVPFRDSSNIIKLGDKWTAEQIEAYHPNNATLRRTHID